MILKYALWGLTTMGVAAAGCSSESSGGAHAKQATETNVTPAACNSDDECPSGVRCLHLHDDATNMDGPSFCEVKEKSNSTTSSTPAPCTKNVDCGPKGTCLHVHGPDGADMFGYCRTDNLVCPRFCDEVNGAVCESDADCGSSNCGVAPTCIF